MLETIRAVRSWNGSDASDRGDQARNLHLDAFVELARQLHPRHGDPIRASAVVGLRPTPTSRPPSTGPCERQGGAEHAAVIITHLAEAWHQGATRVRLHRAAQRPCSQKGPHCRGWMTDWDYR